MAISKTEAQAEYVRRIKAEMQRRSAQHTLSDFILYTSDNYLMGWVHKEICDTLDQFYEDVKARKSPRLIICMPPRSGKSQIVSRAFPAYALGRDPNLNIIATSYSSDLTSSFNRDIQRIIEDDRYSEIFPDTTLSGKKAKKTDGTISFARTSDYFEIVGHKGFYRSTGVGGGITGLGADILILDDVFKDRAEADSATIRQKVWDWYTSTFYTRLSDGGGIIVMLTRWHTDDIIGRLVSHMNDGTGDKFHIINYPAIAEHDEPHRKAGEALHPERFSLERLQGIRNAIGSRDWNALYQQNPVPEGGAVFKLDLFNKWNDKTLPPSFDNVLGSWDMTFKDTKASDYVVGQIWGQKDNSFYLLDEVRGQWDFSKTLEMFILMAEKWRNVNRWLIEDKANGSAILSVLKKHINGLTPITPKESKLERAYAVQPLVESGQVYIPSSASWLAGFEDEFLNFPAGAHDDQVDSFTQALNYCREHTHRKIHQANLLALQQPRFR